MNTPSFDTVVRGVIATIMVHAPEGARVHSAMIDNEPTLMLISAADLIICPVCYTALMAAPVSNTHKLFVVTDARDACVVVLMCKACRKTGFNVVREMRAKGVN